MKTTDSAWLRLVNAARQASTPPEESVPFGFSTRVAALAMDRVSAGPSLASLLGNSSWGALGVALMLMVLSIAANYSSIGNVAETDQDTVVDPVAEILTTS